MRRVLWITAAVLFGIAAWAQNSQVGTGRYDQQIQQEVTKVLQSKDKWKGITASTDDGIVTLLENASSRGQTRQRGEET